MNSLKFNCLHEIEISLSQKDKPIMKIKIDYNNVKIYSYQDSYQNCNVKLLKKREDKDSYIAMRAKKEGT